MRLFLVEMRCFFSVLFVALPFDPWRRATGALALVFRGCLGLFAYYIVGVGKLMGKSGIGKLCVQNSRVSVSFFFTFLMRRKLVTLSSCDGI